MFRAFFAILKSALLAVWNVLFYAGKLLYGILKFLHIRILALYVAVCAVLALFFPVFTDWIVFFWVGFALCSVVTVVSWVLAARRAFNAKPRSAEEEGDGEKAKGEIAAAKEPASPPVAAAPPEPERRPEPTPRKEAAKYPRYFDVEGAPEYFFAEYEDRYELYRREEDGYTYVRTDQKRS